MSFAVSELPGALGLSFVVFAAEMASSSVPLCVAGSAVRSAARGRERLVVLVGHAIRAYEL